MCVGALVGKVSPPPMTFLEALSCGGNVDGISTLPPGVFGALLEDPNEAKAPEPKPNAEEPPTVGDAMTLLPPGVRELKGLDLPCEGVSLPKRLEEEKLRGESVLEESLVRLLDCDVESVSLPEL